MVKTLKYIAILSLSFLLLFPDLLLGTEFKSGMNVIVPESTLIKDDYFVAGDNIKISGMVEGDVISACQTLTLKGRTESNLMAAAEYIDVSGEIGGSFRGGAKNISIDGKLKRNFLGFARSINLKEGSEIGGDVIAYCNELKISGSVGKGVTAGAYYVVISGIINGDVSIRAEEIMIMSNAQIYGNLNYKSHKEAKIGKGALISGETKWTELEAREKGLTWAKVLIEFCFYCAALLTGVFMLLLAKREVKAVKESVFKDFLKNLGLGFVFVICIPIAVVILLFTIIGIPVSLILVFIYFILFYIAKIFVGFALGEKILQAFGFSSKPSPFWSLMFGLSILYLLFLIPYLNCMVYLITLFLGFGAVFQYKKYIIPPLTTT
ncbi:MAG: hypothetical protein OEV55_06500 [candidate division Zixibacteria bacterium]|nr:hypothetical protein [candidate division Zixibacteria bacterium]